MDPAVTRQTVTLARRAMATRFELVLHGDDPVALRAAGEAALDEIDRLEDRLSLYRAGSEIAHVNARAAHEPVRVTAEVFALLEHAKHLHAETEGAFDITIAPLVRCWGFMGGSGHLPAPDALRAARQCVGMHLVELDPERRTVRFGREGVMLDLGAIGKGYAIEQAVRLLREAGVSAALLHAGTSTVYGLGAPPDQDAWNVAIETPPATASIAGFPTLPTVRLRDGALSVSAVWGRTFESGGERFGHVIDPRSGQPVADSLLAAVALDSATETDALSTALLVLGRAGWTRLTGGRPGLRALLVSRQGPRLETLARGL
ncbi:MAG: FAD:protein FMN transferase [Verrucomicrobiae bacterium]|nr:FAD:protein FMN transferase [Verrucomicrobiae bacterium]MDW8310086.1 FAD:protein FMN transferase [Verrucomicrobiales bacterium]